MHLKRRGDRARVLLVLAVATAALPPAGWCEPAAAAATPPFERGDTRRQHGAPGGRGEGPWASGVSEGTGRRLKSPGTAESKRVRASPSPAGGDCGAGVIQQSVDGKFYVAGRLGAKSPGGGYQSDSAGSAQVQRGRARVRGQRPRGSVASWQRLQPVVECGEDAMTLTVRRTRAAQLLLERVNESSVPLSQLPPQCGYYVQTTWRDLGLMVQYDACHVTQEGGSYVLPLLWRGTPVGMSCPVSKPQPQELGPSSLCCAPDGVTVKVQGSSAAEELRVKVGGEWTPLLLLAEQCDYTLDRRGEEVVISAPPLLACGVALKNGRHTLSLKIGERSFMLACPASPAGEIPPTLSPPTTRPAPPSPEPPRPLLWAPPFYLAPPYYPHPTYHGRDAGPEADGAPTSTSSPRVLPSVDPQPDNQGPSQAVPARGMYKHSGLAYLGGRSDEHSAADLSVQAGAPSPPQPPAHAFNPYYHYYHHPKIPHFGPSGDPDPATQAPATQAPAELSPSAPDNLESPVLPPASEQPRQPAPEHPPTPDTHESPVPDAPHPPHLYPHIYLHYLPYVVRGETRLLAPPHPAAGAQTNASAHPRSHSPGIPDHSMSDAGPYTREPDSKESLGFPKYKTERIQQPLGSDDDDDVKVEPDDVTGLPEDHPPSGSPQEMDPVPAPPPLTQLSNHNPPLYYHHPYHLYQMYHGLVGAVGGMSPQPPGEALDPPPRASPSPSARNSPLDPYHYLYHLYRKGGAGTHPDGGGAHLEESAAEAESNGGIGRLGPAGETGVPRPPHGPPHDPRKSPHDPSDDEQRGSAQAASPADPVPVSGLDCGVPFGCCSDLVKGCTVAPLVVLVKPDSEPEPTASPPGASSGVSNASCRMQTMTSDPDVHLVTLDGCAGGKRVFGRVIPEVHPPPRDRGSARENASVRLMVECMSPTSPGDVNLHAMDQSPAAWPAPTTVNAQLRIATDESFSSYHPEAHLPLSLLRGGPTYVEVRLLEPEEPQLGLLLHSCLAYTRAPYDSWMPVYDGCDSQGGAQLLPSAPAHHILRIAISSFPPPFASSSDATEEELAHLDDPEVYFLCLTEVCAAAGGGCAIGCHQRSPR